MAACITASAIQTAAAAAAAATALAGSEAMKSMDGAERKSAVEVTAETENKRMEPEKAEPEEPESSEDSGESSEEEDGENEEGVGEGVDANTPPAPLELTVVTPLQEFLLSKGARRTWRRDPAPTAKPAAAAAKVRARFTGFSGGSTSSDSAEERAANGTALRAAAATDLTTTPCPQNELPEVFVSRGGSIGDAPDSKVVARVDGGFSFNTD